MASREIADTLRQWRETRGLSQRALAERAAMPYPMIARLELGQTDPRLSTLRRLAKALNIPLVDLLSEPKTKRPARKRAPARPAGRGR